MSTFLWFALSAAFAIIITIGLAKLLHPIILKHVGKRGLCAGAMFWTALLSATPLLFILGGGAFYIYLLAGLSGFFMGAFLLPRFIQDTSEKPRKLGKAILGGALSAVVGVVFGLFIAEPLFDQSFDFRGFLMISGFALPLTLPFALPAGIVGAIYVQKVLWSKNKLTHSG